jgi:hypothetical protein
MSWQETEKGRLCKDSIKKMDNKMGEWDTKDDE